MHIRTEITLESPEGKETTYTLLGDVSPADTSVGPSGAECEAYWLLTPEGKESNFDLTEEQQDLCLSRLFEIYSDGPYIPSQED